MQGNEDKEVRMKYKDGTREQKKKNPGRGEILFSPKRPELLCPPPPPASYTMEIGKSEKV
jgi:hypothetical protein